MAAIWEFIPCCSTLPPRVSALYFTSLRWHLRVLGRRVPWILTSEHMPVASFALLCAEHAYICRADLATSASTGLRGLHTTAKVPRGEPVLAIPWDLTLSANVSSTEPHHRVAHHHLEVALALLDSTDRDVVATTHQQTFWQQWAALLPQASELPHPAALPAMLLKELQDSTLIEEAKAVRIYVEQKTGCATRASCDAVHWAMALTRSRPFTLPAPGSQEEATSSSSSEAAGTPNRLDSAASEVFAFLPFIDMANHGGKKANCEVRGVGSRDSATRAYSAAELVALRDLDLGEPITIDYGLEGQTLAAQFADFGFVAPDEAQSLLPDGAYSTMPEDLAKGLQDFVTSLHDDEALLNRYDEGRELPTDARLPSIVRYRVMRKRAFMGGGTEEEGLLLSFVMGVVRAPPSHSVRSFP